MTGIGVLGPIRAHDWCFHAFAKTERGTRTPVIQGRDVAAVRAKLEYLYPGGELLGVTAAHESARTHRKPVAA